MMDDDIGIIWDELKKQHALRGQFALAHTYADLHFSAKQKFSTAIIEAIKRINLADQPKISEAAQ